MKRTLDRISQIIVEDHGSPDKVKSFYSSFSKVEQDLFQQRNVPVEFANQRTGFPAGYICHLFDLKVGSNPDDAREVRPAREYAEDEFAAELESLGWSNPEPWRNFDISAALTYGIHQRSLMETKLIMANNISVDVAAAYDAKHYGWRIIQLLQVSMPAKDARAYSAGCKGCKLDIPDEEHSTEFSVEHALAMYNLGISPSKVKLALQYDLHVYLLDYVQGRQGKINMLGAGKHSIVLFDSANHETYKFTKSLVGRSRRMRERSEIGEDELLSMLNNPRHVIKILDVQDYVKASCTADLPEWCSSCHYSVLQLEYIKGKTIEELLESGPLPTERVVRYGDHTFRGLLELRAAGIYHHRDIRPANIMIDEELDRGVIIDLGSATTDKDALAKGNRGFGSPTGRRANDLNSLGQVVYKMLTGKHIFAESRSMEQTTYADELQDQRDWIYEEPERLVPYLKQVERTIVQPTLQEIVRFCLVAEGRDRDYEYLRERFAAVGGDS